MQTVTYLPHGINAGCNIITLKDQWNYLRFVENGISKYYVFIVTQNPMKWDYCIDSYPRVPLYNTKTSGNICMSYFVVEPVKAVGKDSFVPDFVERDTVCGKYSRGEYGKEIFRELDVFGVSGAFEY